MSSCPHNSQAVLPGACFGCVLQVKGQCIADQYPASQYGFYFQGRSAPYRNIKLVVNPSDGMAVFPKSEARKDQLRGKFNLLHLQIKAVNPPTTVVMSDEKIDVTYEIESRGSE